MLRAALLLVLAALRPAPALGQDCWNNALCIDAVQVGDRIDFYVDNLLPGAITVELTATVQNLASEADFPHVATYPGRRRTKAFSLDIANPYAAWSYRYDFRWAYGSLEARHDDDDAYRLPYAPGTAYRVLQGFNGPFSHTGKHAVDWEMPEGTAVHAARGGVVVAVRDTSTVGGLEDRYRERANYILIEHPDGTLGHYLHLMPGGARVEVGQRVYAGQPIGLSGNTGYSSGPHLHFEVTTLTPDLAQRTFPIRFLVEDGRAAFLQPGTTYRAASGL